MNHTATGTQKRFRLFPTGQIPKVDAHCHAWTLEDMGKLRRRMTCGGIALCVNLSTSRELFSVIAQSKRRGNPNVLPALGQYGIKKGLWWSDKDLKTFKVNGCVGTKIHFNYQTGLNRPAIISKIRVQERLGGLPLWLHVANPPRPGFWKPTFWDRIADTEKLVARHPDLTIILAHGGWLMIDDKSLDVLAGWFDQYPNLNVDLSAVYQWWDPPEPSYEKLRGFVQTYSERLLYGTDALPEYGKKIDYENSYRILETRDQRLPGFFGRDRETYIRGLGLSNVVLNRIYWQNAARLIPRVGESLCQLGWDF